MAGPIITDFYDELINAMEQRELRTKIDTFWLGGTAGPSGGQGIRPGGYIGTLNQTLISYDTTEAATIAGSGSLLDNLNHIRYNIITISGMIASGVGSPLTVREFDTIPTVSGVRTITFSGLSVDDRGNGEVIVSSSNSSVTLGSQNSIHASSGIRGSLAYAIDTENFYIYESGWLRSPFSFVSVSGKDMGYYTENNSRIGYGTTYITDKLLSNVVLGGSVVEQNGSIRVNTEEDPDTLEIYLRDQWNTVVYDLTTEYGDFRHAPIDEQIYVWAGNSVTNGLNGLPIVQQYQVSMGAYPYPVQINGGTF
jgi:hypothetical protein